jgi:uncharacterized peroxidase-related enzyme
MHLRVLYDAQRLRARLALGAMRTATRMDPDAVARVSLYRPSFFGRHFLELVASVLRGPSEWSPGERELLGALVSGLNQCPYCVQVHSAIVALRADMPMDPARVLDWREQRLDARLAAALELVELVTLRPEELPAAAIERARAAGLSDAAILDAVYVAFVFNTINRIANALGFDWGGAVYARRGAAMLDRMAYRVPDFLLR